MNNHLPRAVVAALLLRVLAPALAELGVANNAGVLAVEEDVLQRLLGQVGAIQDALQIGLGKACNSNQRM